VDLGLAATAAALEPVADPLAVAIVTAAATAVRT
jgi:hypothetical protein